jgi:hypothetical protein
MIQYIHFLQVVNNVYVPVRLLVGCVVIARSCYSGKETASEKDMLLVLHREHSTFYPYYRYLHSLRRGDSHSDKDNDDSMKADPTKRIV